MDVGLINNHERLTQIELDGRPILSQCHRGADLTSSPRSTSTKTHSLTGPVRFERVCCDFGSLTPWWYHGSKIKPFYSRLAISKDVTRNHLKLGHYVSDAYKHTTAVVMVTEM